MRRELSESAMDAVFDSFCGSPLSIIADRYVESLEGTRVEIFVCRNEHHFLSSITTGMRLKRYFLRGGSGVRVSTALDAVTSREYQHFRFR